MEDAAWDGIRDDQSAREAPILGHMVNSEVSQDENDQDFASIPRDTTLCLRKTSSTIEFMASPIPGGFNILNNQFFLDNNFEKGGSGSQGWWMS